jgi:hypothetical protein
VKAMALLQQRFLLQAQFISHLIAKTFMQQLTNQTQQQSNLLQAEMVTHSMVGIQQRQVEQNLSMQTEHWFQIGQLQQQQHFMHNGRQTLTQSH